MRYGVSPLSSFPSYFACSPLGFLGKALALAGLVQHKYSRDLPQALRVLGVL